MKNKSWKQFIESREKPIGLRVPDVKEPEIDDSVKVDDTLTGDPKEYTKLKKFLAGTNKPDPIPKNRWFVVDENSGHIWHNNGWVNPANVDSIAELEEAIKSEESANVLASVVHGVPVCIDETLTNEWPQFISGLANKAKGAGKKVLRSLGLRRPTPLEDPDYYKPRDSYLPPQAPQKKKYGFGGYDGNDLERR